MKPGVRLKPNVRATHQLSWASAGGKGHFPHWKEANFSRKSEIRSLIPMDWFNSCIDSLFAGMTLTLHKSQVHCLGVMHAVMSLHFTHVRSFSCRGRLRNWQADFYRWSLLHNNNMATNLQSFTSNNGRRRFAACDVTALNADVLAGDAARHWLLISERHVVLYGVKKNHGWICSNASTSLKNLLLGDTVSANNVPELSE